MIRTRKIPDEVLENLRRMILELADEAVPGIPFYVFINKLKQKAKSEVWFYDNHIDSEIIEDAVVREIRRESIFMRKGMIIAYAKVKEESVMCNVIMPAIASAPERPVEPRIFDENYNANWKLPPLLDNAIVQPLNYFGDSAQPFPIMSQSWVGGAFVPLEKGFGLRYDPFYNMRRLWSALNDPKMMHPMEGDY